MVIDAEKILTTARIVVDNQGHEHWQEIPRSLYVVDNWQFCIVAHILVELGMPLQWLAEYDNVNGESVSVAMIDFPADWFVLSEAIDMLATLQDMADTGVCWGHCLDAIS